MKKIILTIIVLTIPLLGLAQNKPERYSPQKGSFSIGLSIDPLSASAFKFQPKAGEFLGSYITSIANNPQQMFMISPSSALAINMKYYTSATTALKFTIGFSGSYSNYKEYVSDDYAVSCIPTSQDVVTDVLKSSVNGASLSAGFEKVLGTRAFRFTFGASLAYAIGGGALTMQYGNSIGLYNDFDPSVMPVCARIVDGAGKVTSQGALNNLSDVDCQKMGYVNGRPILRYNMGACQSLGLMADMGLEWFCFDRVSIGAQLSILPVCVYFQPQTYSVYEGFSTLTGNVEQYNKLVSPGSNSITYGLDNLGLKISLNYYL